MEIVKIRLCDITPYNNNPRINDHAVDAVAESIRQCSYIAPIVVDENHVILAGHTRYKALKKLGHDDAEVIVKAGLTEDQKRKYRLLDNKTGELADWDFELLEAELDGLDFDGFDFGFDRGNDDFDGTGLDDESVDNERYSCKFTFNDFKTYKAHEQALKDFAMEIGAIYSVDKT